METVVIIGAGHNGLVAAYLLARRGCEVHVLESSAHVGGACVTKRFPCGCKVNEAANAFGMAPNMILEYTAMEGLRDEVIVPDPQVVLLDDSSNSVALYSSLAQTLKCLPAHAKKEAPEYRRFVNDLGIAADVLAPFLIKNPVSTSDVVSALESAQTGLGSRFLLGSIRAAIESYLHTDLMQAVAVAGAPMYPALTSEPGTAFALIYAAQSAIRGKGGWGIVPGGIGRFTEQLAQQLSAIGGTISVNCPVTRIHLEGGVVASVETPVRSIKADIVIAAINPFLALTTLFRDGDLDRELVDAIEPTATEGGCAKLNLILDRPLSHWIAAWPTLQGRHSALFAYCPSLRYLDLAYADFVLGRPSAEPYFELTFQGDSGHGMTCGEHTPVSAFVLYVPHARTRHAAFTRHEVERLILRHIDRLFPSFSEHVLASTLLLPEDIERNYGMLLGNVDHGSMCPNNLFDNRPVPHKLWQSHRPTGLILGNAGRHPGGLVTGIPGYLAYKEAVQELNVLRKVS